MRKSVTRARQGSEMVFTPDPVIPMKVETLLGNIDNKMEGIRRDISSINDSLHKKADKSDLDKLDARFEDLQRNGSDTARRAEKAERELATKVDSNTRDVRDELATLQRDMATRSAVESNTIRVEESERTAKFQWIGIGITLFIALAQLIGTMVKH